MLMEKPNIKSPFPGYITPLLVRVLPMTSPLWKMWKRIRGVKPSEAERHAKIVEEYIAIWGLLITACSVSLVLTQGRSGTGWIILAVLPTLRVVDIFQANFVRHIFAGEHDTEALGQTASVSRLIVIAIINYVELIFSFALIYASICRAHGGTVSDASTWLDFTYFSGITQLTIGYGDYAPTGFCRAISILQGMLGLALAVFIFARFSSLIPDQTKRNTDYPK
jgi:potassium channel LctB